jgi:uncharacterized protein (DUF433 family)
METATGCTIVIGRKERTGGPRVKGTKVKVADVLGALSKGLTVEELGQLNPKLKGRVAYDCFKVGLQAVKRRDRRILKNFREGSYE